MTTTSLQALANKAAAEFISGGGDWANLAAAILPALEAAVVESDKRHQELSDTCNGYLDIISRRDKELTDLRCRMGQIDNTVQERDQLREVLGELFALIESGVLVRDVSHDADPKWYLKAMELTQVLKKAQYKIRSEN